MTAVHRAPAVIVERVEDVIAIKIAAADGKNLVLALDLPSARRVSTCLAEAIVNPAGCRHQAAGGEAHAS